jgi:uncharacterized protein YbjT (DUF2867 family)
MASDTTSVLVIGATGTVGREAVLATTAAGGRVRALVRSQARGAAIQDPAGAIELVHGDLRDEAAVARALDGVSAALYVSPHEPDEELLADRFIRACERSGARIVFVGVHVDGATRLSRAVRRFLFGRVLPHYGLKLRISERVRTSATRPVVLMPTNFYQNDELFRSEILAGSFPQAFARVNRVDVRDIGRAIARALLDPTLPAGAYPVVGPTSVTGEECAAAWTAAFGREVRYEPSRMISALERSLSGKKRDDFLATYGVLGKLSLRTDPKHVERTAALIGRPPCAYETYVRETAKQWTAASNVPPERAARGATNGHSAAAAVFGKSGNPSASR